MIVDYVRAAPYLKLIRFGVIKSNHSNRSNHQRSNQIIQIYIWREFWSVWTRNGPPGSVEETQERSTCQETDRNLWSYTLEIIQTEVSQIWKCNWDWVHRLMVRNTCFFTNMCLVNLLIGNFSSITLHVSSNVWVVCQTAKFGFYDKLITSLLLSNHHHTSAPGTGISCVW